MTTGTSLRTPRNRTAPSRPSSADERLGLVLQRPPPHQQQNRPRLPLAHPGEGAQHVGVVLGDLEPADGEPDELVLDARGAANRSRAPGGTFRIRSVSTPLGTTVSRSFGHDALADEPLGRRLADDRHVVHQPLVNR